MDRQLQRALEPVLHDLHATSGRAPARIEEDDWATGPDTASAMIWSLDGSGTGVHVRLGDPLVDQVVHVTDQVHEWAVEELWGSAPTDWPRCPFQPSTHPLVVARTGSAAWWVCPHDSIPVAEVGALG